MRICLVNPPDTTKRYEDAEYNHCFFTIPHIGLGYIGAILRSEGFQVDIFECIGQEISLSALFEKLAAGNYLAIGISTYYYNFINVVRIVKTMKARNINGFIFIGGFLPTLHCETVFQSIPEVDCCVIGEGERTSLELMKSLANQQDWKQVSGIAFWSKDRIVKTNERPLTSNLDELPFPARVFVCKHKMASLITSRGCHGQCIFCGVKEFFNRCPGHKYRLRSPENVVAEIEYLIEQFQIEYLFINDDNFLGTSIKQKEWLHHFCRLMKDKPFDIQFRINVRADEVVKNRDILAKLKEVGLNGLFIGVESFVQRQLDFYKKMTTVEDNIQAIQIAAELQIKVNIGFIMLEPFAALDEIITNLEILQNTDFCHMAYEGHLPISLKSPLIPIMGTPVYHFLKEKGLLNGSPIGYDFGDAKVTLFHQVIQYWGSFIQPVHEKYYLIYEAKKIGDLQMRASLKQLKADLLRLDLMFMKELAMGIQSGHITPSGGDQLIDNYRDRLSAISEAFQDCKKILHYSEAYS
jgi:radical SAM superfamily enzyme YgiQ (UPF0313 family)